MHLRTDICTLCSIKLPPCQVLHQGQMPALSKVNLVSEHEMLTEMLKKVRLGEHLVG